MDDNINIIISLDDNFDSNIWLHGTYDIISTWIIWYDRNVIILVNDNNVILHLAGNLEVNIWINDNTFTVIWIRTCMLT